MLENGRVQTGGGPREQKTGERSLYLFVKCSVQEIRNDQEESAPSPQAKPLPQTSSSTDP